MSNLQIKASKDVAAKKSDEAQLLNQASGLSVFKARLASVLENMPDGDQLFASIEHFGIEIASANYLYSDERKPAYTDYSFTPPNRDSDNDAKINTKMPERGAGFFMNVRF